MAEGLLTPVQHQLLRIVQEAGRDGLTTAEIWKAFRKQHRVARTTVLKMIERLEAREWLTRVPSEDENDRVRYRSTMSPPRTALRMLQHFVDEYYEGSAADLIEDLLRFKCLPVEEQERLRCRLDRGCGSPACVVCHRRITSG
jgi:predicted transcriptional regulator